MMGSASMSARIPITRVAGKPALDHADDAGPAYAGDDLVTAEFPELLLDDPGGTMDVIIKLGVFVQVAAPSGDFVGKSRDTVDDGHENLELFRRSAIWPD